MTRMVPGSGFGAGAVISGSMPVCGRITPSDLLSLSLSVPVEPVLEGSLGATFSGMVFWVPGMFGSRGG